ncbi:hypothetical protein [Nonomuraea sp. NPDC005650]|uniref:hypothetical protein n=1 Tax=Nonomuraea sp. NPDC005650 TaxID=3157045 RepID=UPI0033AE531F
MRIRLGLPAAAALVLTTGFVVACSDEQPACASVREQPAAVATGAPARTNTSTNTGTQQRSVPNTRTLPTAQPYKPSTSRPLIRQQPKVTYRTGTDHQQYRHFDGFPGWYPVGVWPYGYADQYGCAVVSGQEGDGIDDLDDLIDGD